MVLLLLLLQAVVGWTREITKRFGNEPFSPRVSELFLRSCCAIVCGRAPAVRCIGCPLAAD